MAPKPRLFSFTYDDIQTITDKSKNNLYQDTDRQRWNDSDLVSFLLYVFRNAKPEIKMQLLKSLIE
jgi:hypothetical protein